MISWSSPRVNYEKTWISILLIHVFFGCYSENAEYIPEDKERITAKATELVLSWLETDELYHYGISRVREERRDGESGALTVTDDSVNPETDLLFEKTAYEFRYSRLNENWGFCGSGRLERKQ